MMQISSEKRRFFAIVCAAALVWLAGGFACVFFGPVLIRPAEVLAILWRSASSESPAHVDIVLNQRLPRVALAMMVGGGLAVTGAVFQALLRNPLATPHVLGVSAGGALGAVVALSAGLAGSGLGAISGVQLFALLGALTNAAIVYGLARRREAFSTLKLLLAGVTLGLICSALIMFVRYMSEPHKLVVMDRWLMGGLSLHGYRSLAATMPLFLPALALLLTLPAALNQLSFGEEVAAGRGINVKAVQAQSFLGGAVLTAAVVSVAGPIGFVGLIVPHLLRFLFGPEHRVLLFASFFFGGVFLAVADTFARTAFGPAELPVGVLTAMLGGPFFLILLVTRVR